MWLFGGCSAGSCCGNGRGTAELGGALVPEEYDPGTRASAEEAEGTSSGFPAMARAAEAASAKGHAGATQARGLVTPLTAHVAAALAAAASAAPNAAGGDAAAGASAAAAAARGGPKAVQFASIGLAGGAAEAAAAPHAPSAASGPPPARPAAAGAVATEPVEKGRRFVAELARGESLDWGVQLMPVGPMALELHSLRDGPPEESPAGGWNRAADRAPGRPRICAGDLVLAINGVRGNVTEMWQRWKEDEVVRCEIYKPSEVPICVVKDGPLGINIQSGEVSLFIDQLNPGPFTLWNDAHPGQEAREGDRIVAIGGRRMRASELLEALKAASGTVELVLAQGPHEFRPAPS